MLLKKLVQGHTASSESETDSVTMHFTLYHTAKAGYARTGGQKGNANSRGPPIL